MLTRAQIQRLAQRNGIGLQAQERDYLQHLLLYWVFQRAAPLVFPLVFKGGTALRIVYRGNRYSEDLDFNSPEEVPQLRALWQNVIKDLEAFGARGEMRNEWVGEVGYSFDVSYQGPLYDGRDRTKGKVRVDLNRRAEQVEVQRELVSPEYDDLRPFVIPAMSKAHMLAEKVRALLTRGKPRDLYDYWLLTQQEVRVDIPLVNQKLALYDMTYHPTLFAQALEKIQPEWERDLRPLLPQFIPWETILRGLDYPGNA